MCLRNRKLTGLLIAVAGLLATAVPASAQLSSLHFGEYKITGIHPNSFRSADGSASIVCTNSGKKFTMSNIRGTVYKKGTPFVSGYASPVTVPAGKTTLDISGNASLCDGVSIWDLLACIVFRAEDYKIDVAMTITDASGEARLYEKKGINVAALLHNIRGR